MAKQQEPVICYDGHEHWVVYPDDNAYSLVSKAKPDKDGVRPVEPETVEMLKGWWWRKAVQKVESMLDDFNIPWEDLHVTKELIEAGDLMELSKVLAETSHYIVRVNQQYGLIAARLSAAKEALDQATHQILGSREAQQEETAGRKPAIAVRVAALIHKQKPLRNAKIEVIEATAFMRALEQTKESLDVLWRTASRIISARLKEPID